MMLLAASTACSAQTVAFPGAEGFGALATGGRAGKKIVHVTNLNAEGPGSLADAISADNRIVVFDVAGVIKLTPSQMVTFDKRKNITVLGQTAPGEGITVYGNRVNITNCENIIVRYLRIRGSINMNRSKAALTMDGAKNVILDHCSISWGRWDNVHIKNAQDITWQYCIVSEGIDPQRFGAITDGTSNWTINHCLWIDNHSRNPKMKCNAQMINSVVYNGGNGVVGGHSAADFYQDLVNNYYISGPDGESKYSQWTATDHLYQSGNLMDGNMDGSLNGSAYTNTDCTNMPSPHFAPQVAVTVESPASAYEHIVEQVGCSRQRDIHDIRLITQLKSLGKLGKTINSEGDVGGIGTLNTGTPYTDTDADGIPDEWEKAHNLNPSDPADATATAPDGYLWIEDYANSLVTTDTRLTCPIGLSVAYSNSKKNSASLKWTNTDSRATTIILEQSTDGKTFNSIDSFPARSTFRTVKDIDSTKTYWFRLQATDGTLHSSYSNVAVLKKSLSADEKPGGGTPAGQSSFAPESNKLYYIICYTTRFFNSAATTTGGTPYYLKAGTRNGSPVLTSTTTFNGNSKAILWHIEQDDSDAASYTIMNDSTGQTLVANNTGSDGYAALADVDEDSTTHLFQINYASDLAVKSDGEKYSFYRINSKENHNYQLRGRSGTQWLWSNGTINRADMLFTFRGKTMPNVDTGISLPKSQLREDKAWYTLQGQRTNAPRRGIYIHNGKKWVVK